MSTDKTTGLSSKTRKETVTPAGRRKTVILDLTGAPVQVVDRGLTEIAEQRQSPGGRRDAGTDLR